MVVRLGWVGGPGGEAPPVQAMAYEGVRGGGAPRFTSARRPNGGPGACPRVGRLG